MPGSSIAINRKDEISERMHSVRRAAFHIGFMPNHRRGWNIHNLLKEIGLIAPDVIAIHRMVTVGKGRSC